MIVLLYTFSWQEIPMLGDRLAMDFLCVHCVQYIVILDLAMLQNGINYTNYNALFFIKKCSPAALVYIGT